VFAIPARDENDDEFCADPKGKEAVGKERRKTASRGGEPARAFLQPLLLTPTGDPPF